MKYQPEFALLAYNTLSKPFKTIKHVCLELKVSVEKFRGWYEEIDTLREAVENGMMAGEVKARNILMAASLAPANKVNTKLLTALAQEVYGISIEDEDGADGIKEGTWNVTFVGTENPTKVEAISHEKETL